MKQFYIFLCAACAVMALISCKTVKPVGDEPVDGDDVIVLEDGREMPVTRIRIDAITGTNLDRRYGFGQEIGDSYMRVTCNNTCPDWDYALGEHYIKVCKLGGPYSNVYFNIKLYKVADEFGNELDEKILLGECELNRTNIYTKLEIFIQGGGGSIPVFLHLFPHGYAPYPDCSIYDGDLSNCPYKLAFCLIHGEDRYGYYELQVEFIINDYEELIEFTAGGFSYRHEENVEMMKEFYDSMNMLETFDPGTHSWEERLWDYHNVYGAANDE